MRNVNFNNTVDINICNEPSCQKMLRQVLQKATTVITLITTLPHWWLVLWRFLVWTDEWPRRVNGDKKENRLAYSEQMARQICPNLTPIKKSAALRPKIDKCGASIRKTFRWKTWVEILGLKTDILMSPTSFSSRHLLVANDSDGWRNEYKLLSTRQSTYLKD